MSVCGRRISLFATLLAVAALVGPKGSAQSLSLPVVPGAYGYGMGTRASYGGGTAPAILRVTNLNDSGAGSLRAALTAQFPRIVIFEVSGYINLSSQINIDSPYLTVAGQTAPSPGITIRMTGTFANEAMILVWTHDTLWQHFAIRPGHTTCNSGMQFYDGGSGSNVYNNILDHMSVSWAQDEGVAFTDRASNSTMWRSIVAEVLQYAPGSGGCSGGGYAQNGVGIGTGANIAILQSLLAHNVDRNPQMGGSSQVYLANNLFYAPALGPWWARQDWEGTAFRGAANGNYFRRDSNTKSVYYAIRVTKALAGSQLYLKDNVFDNGPVSPAFTEFVYDGGIDPRVGSLPFAAPAGYTPLSGAATYAHVLANAGARPADRDTVDQRIVDQVKARTGRYLSTVNDVGGYPTLAANWRPLTVPPDPHMVTSSGYTNVEAWLHTFANSVTGDQ